MSEVSGIDNSTNLVEKVFGVSLEKQFESIQFAWRESYYVGGADEPLAKGTNRSTGYGISDKPIRVTSIRNCCNVNLIGNVYSAATHYPEPGYLGSNYVPEEYLPMVIEALKSKGESNFFATVVGGDRVHFERILKVLKSQKIPVVGKFRDKPRDGRYLDKWVVVIPGKRRTILETRDGLEKSFKKLS